MEFDKMLKDFEFLFDDKEDVHEDLMSVEKNISILENKKIYAEIALKYIRNCIKEMAPITLLTNLGLLSIGESLGLINYPRRINQFEMDFVMALVLKFGVMQMNYSMACGEREIDRLLKAVTIYIFCLDHQLISKSLDAHRINSYYRTSRIVGFDESKLNIIERFCREYDKHTSDEKIKLEKVIRFIRAFDRIMVKRLETISGHVIYLEDQYKFFQFSPIDIQIICNEEKLDYLKTIQVLMQFSVRIGDLKNKDVQEIYLYNPINDKFVLAIEQGFFFVPNVSVVVENLFGVLENIVDFDSQNKQIYSDIRAEYLEKETAELIYHKFRDVGKVYLNSEWDDIGHGENDCTLVYEDYAIVFEDKSGKIDRKTYKGILNSAMKDNIKLVVDPSEQATHFAILLRKNIGKEISFKIKGGGKNVIDLRKVKHILKVGIIFEETVLQNMALEGKRHSPIISIFQLYKIFECLKREEIIDYIVKRSVVEENVFYCGDEYDLLYTYLKNGLNVSEIYSSADRNSILFIPYTEKSISRKDIDREEWFQTIIDSTIEQAKENWLDIVISLLEIPPVVQRQIIREIFIKPKLMLLDEKKSQNKLIIVNLLEFYDCDTEIEIEEDLNSHKDYSNILYIAFTKSFEHIIVKMK